MLDVAAVRAPTGQRPDFPTLADKRPRDRRADKSGRARHQRLHDGRVSKAAGASEPVLAMVASERLAALYRCARRSKGASALGASASAPTRRQICRCPSLSAAAVTARGKTSHALSTITRTARKGSPCCSAISATAALSMSTATAPVVRYNSALSSTDPSDLAAVKSLPVRV